MAITIVTHSGYCDFCGKHEGKFAIGSPDSNRDICESCAKEAVRAFDPFTFHSSSLWYPSGSSNKSSIKNMLHAFTKRLLDGDTKKLIKAGYLDKELNLTSEGESELMALILENNKKEFVKSAEEKIEEEESKK